MCSARKSAKSSVCEKGGKKSAKREADYSGRQVYIYLIIYIFTGTYTQATTYIQIYIHVNIQTHPQKQPRTYEFKHTFKHVHICMYICRCFVSNSSRSSVCKKKKIRKNKRKKRWQLGSLTNLKMGCSHISNLMLISRWALYVWHDSFVCVTWRIYTCDTTHLYVWRDLLNNGLLSLFKSDVDLEVCFVSVTWLIRTCDMAHPDVWHDAFICVTWLT